MYTPPPKEIFKNGYAIIEEKYNEETGEITFKGKIKTNLKTKTGKRIFYYSAVTDYPAITQYFKPLKFNKNTNTKEKEEADEKIKEQFNIEID